MPRAYSSGTLRLGTWHAAVDGLDVGSCPLAPCVDVRAHEQLPPQVEGRGGRPSTERDLVDGDRRQQRHRDRARDGQADPRPAPPCQPEDRQEHDERHDGETGGTDIDREAQQEPGRRGQEQRTTARATLAGRSQRQRREERHACHCGREGRLRAEQEHVEPLRWGDRQDRHRDGRGRHPSHDADPSCQQQGAQQGHQQPQDLAHDRLGPGPSVGLAQQDGIAHRAVGDRRCPKRPADGQAMVGKPVAREGAVERNDHGRAPPDEQGDGGDEPSCWPSRRDPEHE